jgi:hypothetical protein
MSSLGIVLFVSTGISYRCSVRLGLNTVETNLDLAISLKSEPLGNGPMEDVEIVSCCTWSDAQHHYHDSPVLLGSLGQNDLGSESLVGRHLAISS